MSIPTTFKDEKGNVKQTNLLKIPVGTKMYHGASMSVDDARHFFPFSGSYFSRSATLSSTYSVNFDSKVQQTIVGWVFSFTTKKEMIIVDMDARNGGEYMLAKGYETIDKNPIGVWNQCIAKFQEYSDASKLKGAQKGDVKILKLWASPRDFVHRMVVHC